MTALREYQRLEATALWRAGADMQRREVVISIGDATLVITDMQDRPLTHWSLAAIERQNPGKLPAIYHPDGDPEETLELAEDETEMIAAIERLRRAVERARPRPGRLRSIGVLASVLLVLVLLVVWLPGAMKRHALRVVPDITRTEIGDDLLARISRAAGQPCRRPGSHLALARLAGRTGVDELYVLRAGLAETLSLPGGPIVLNRALVEDHEDPAVVAGYILAEELRGSQVDPLRALLQFGGPVMAFRLLTTGDVTDAQLDAYARHLLQMTPAPVDDTALLAAFATASIPSTPYAYARDVTGESVLALIEGDPMAGRDAPQVLRDRDWLLVQDICGG
ncbi:MAG: hypothetical protein OIF47_12020 [Marinibacterium sp.]|nr:hypothetical protein [Marinibacterium sp.]